jgi:hypothetical protein
MNGPDNFLAAEQLIDDAKTAYAGDDTYAALLMAEAMVRATLALAAATAHAHMSTRGAGDWNTVTR